jgi:hypothetical protein
VERLPERAAFSVLLFNLNMKCDCESQVKVFYQGDRLPVGSKILLWLTGHWHIQQERLMLAV